mgnify:CR=1 FL=1
MARSERAPERPERRPRRSKYAVEKGLEGSLDSTAKGLEQLLASLQGSGFAEGLSSYRTLQAVLVLPDDATPEPMPAVLVLHGSGGLFSTPDSNDTKLEVSPEFADWAGMLTERGYAGASIELIARAAQLSVGAIYLYFRSKEDLYVSLIEDTLTVFDVEMVQVREQAEVGRFAV